MYLVIKPNSNHACRRAAKLIIDAIKKHNETKQRPFVLGLPTGGSPLAIYAELVKAYRAEESSFKNVVTFNMDEYWRMQAHDASSYAYYMRQNFFDHVDVPAENINLLDGDTASPDDECQAYEAKINSYGGIDLFLGGMGQNGHLAFNEIGSGFGSVTRLIDLNESTRCANSRFFGEDVKIPSQALSVGLATILAAKKIVLIVTGDKKAQAMKNAIESGLSHLCPASALQIHGDVTIFCDEEAVSKLQPVTVALLKKDLQE